MTPFQEQSTAAHAARAYAGFWRRFIAFLIDAFVFGIVAAITGAFAIAAAGAPLSALADYAHGFNVLFQVLYFSLFESSARQATPGKMAVGIVVTDLKGERISFWHAAGRTLGKIISMLTLFVGFLMAAFTSRKQTLHDMLAGCLVVKRHQ